MILELLLKNGANIEAETNLGSTSLHFAVNIPNGEIASDYEKAAKILIQMGARLDIKDGDGQAPIHLAVLKRRPSMVAMLVKNGVSLKIRNQDGLTPLECALKHSLRCIKVLLYGGIIL